MSNEDLVTKPATPVSLADTEPVPVLVDSLPPPPPAAVEEESVMASVDDTVPAEVDEDALPDVLSDVPLPEEIVVEAAAEPVIEEPAAPVVEEPAASPAPVWEPLPSHRVDAVPADFDPALLPDEHAELVLKLADKPLARFDELRLSPAEVNALLGLGVKLVLMPHLPLPADVLIADMHAHEHADPHVAVLLKVPEDSHPELLERVAVENANRELVAASNREQARVAAENAAREEAKRVAEKK